MKVILFISFFIGFNSKSVGDSTLAESIETQKQKMKGLNSISRCRQAGSAKLLEQLDKVNSFKAIKLLPFSGLGPGVDKRFFCIVFLIVSRENDIFRK